MLQVPFEKLNEWKQLNNNDYILPSSIDCICGFCHKQSSLTTTLCDINSQILTASMMGRCTRCGQTSKVFILNVRNQKQWQNNDMSCECWVYPKTNIRDYRFRDEDIAQPRIARAYKDAIDSFNEGRASLSITACGRVVEAIAKTTFPNAASTNQIGRLFQKLNSESQGLDTEFQNLLSPLFSLGEALRIGRNTGGHFDFNKEPNRELAGKILDLTEFLMQYTYSLQSEADNVNTLINSLDPQEL